MMKDHNQRLTCMDKFKSFFKHFKKDKRKESGDSNVDESEKKRKLPVDILQRSLFFVVLQDGCSAILRLSLTCQRFNNIVRQEQFRQGAHFSWLDSVVNWKRYSKGHHQKYRKPYTISRCSRLQCSQLYKDCGAGYQGNGQQGVFWEFYSSDDHPGYCSWDCYTEDGGFEV